MRVRGELHRERSVSRELIDHGPGLVARAVVGDHQFQLALDPAWRRPRSTCPQVQRPLEGRDQHGDLRGLHG